MQPEELGIENADNVIVAIDLKSFYASVECRDRGLDPLKTNLVVADISRTEKTIGLAVSPSLKAYGIPGRPRLFEVIQKVEQVNAARRQKAPKKELIGESYFPEELQKDPSLAVGFIIAQPRMRRYMEVSAEIYNIYLRYVAPEDIHVYSVDEVFIDITAYIKTRKCSAHDFTMILIRDVLKETGITATAGIGTNMYLAKIAMDIVAKQMAPDKDGVRIAELDEMSYRRQLWDHTPITDFWRVGRGYAKKLQSCGIYTMGDVARCSIDNEDTLYSMFGVNAELLIDHAWGWEPCTIKQIKEYRPQSNSTGAAQVLSSPYTIQKARIIVQEMVDSLSMDLLDKGLVADQIVLEVGYDAESLRNISHYDGDVTADRYGRTVPKHAHGSKTLDKYTSSCKLLTKAALDIYDKITDPHLLVRRLSISAAHIISEKDIPSEPEVEQLDLFTDYEKKALQEERAREALKRERSIQEAVLELKRKYGKNIVLKGTNFLDGATMRDRNEQIGGHKA